MTRKSFIMGLIIIFSLISGCSTAEMFLTKKDDLIFSEITGLYNQINEEEWTGALSKVNDLEEKYEQRKWKIFLLGTTDDIRDLEIEMELLKENIQEKDDAESKLGLKEIKYRIYSLYNI